MLRLHGKPGDYQQPSGWPCAVTQAYMPGRLLGGTALWERDAGSCEVLTFGRFLWESKASWFHLLSCDKMPDEGSLGAKGFVSAPNPRLQSITAGRSRQNLKMLVTSQPQSGTEEERMHASVCSVHLLSLFFIQSRTHA